MCEPSPHTGSSVCLRVRCGRLCAGALLLVVLLLAQGCVPANAAPGTMTLPFYSNTASALAVDAGSNVLAQVGGSISGTFRAFPLGEGNFTSDPAVTGGSNFGFDAERNLYTFDYHIRGLSDVANGDQLGWEGDGKGSYTEGCLTATPDCAIRIDVTYDRYFGTGRYADASGLINEVIQVNWQSATDETATYAVSTHLTGWINY